MEARHRNSTGWIVLALTAALPLVFVACDSSRWLSGTQNQSQNGSLALLIEDGSTEDWATIGVKAVSISLTPQGGGFTGDSVHRLGSSADDQPGAVGPAWGEILGNVPVPAGAYAGATLTVGGNPGDVVLTVSADPETGFAGTPGATIPSSQIQIKGSEGNSGGRTVPVKVTFDAPLVLTANQSMRSISTSIFAILGSSWRLCRSVPGRRCGRSTLTLSCGIIGSATSRGWCCGPCTER